MFFAVFEEAHTQYRLEGTMPEEDWRAWRATIDRVCRRPYVSGLWQRVGPMYSDSFRRFMDEALQPPPQA